MTLLHIKHTPARIMLLFLIGCLLSPAFAQAKFYSLDAARNGKKTSASFKSLRSADTKALNLPRAERTYSLKRFQPILRSIAAIREQNNKRAQEATTQLASLNKQAEQTKSTRNVPGESISDALPAQLPSTLSTSKPLTSIKHRWPIDAKSDHYISSQFGMRRDPFNGKEAFHAGLDIAAAKGTAVLASAAGNVTGVGSHPRLGTYVKVTHADDSYSLYGHLSDTNVMMGDTVRPGQKIAEVGSTGRSTGNHLDYSLRIHGEPVNPLDYLTPPTTKRQLAQK